MRKLLILLLIITAGNSYGQTYIGGVGRDTAFDYQMLIDTTITLDHKSEIDTVKIYLLLSECNGCNVKSIEGYAIRKSFIYNSAINTRINLFTVFRPETGYEIIGYLNKKKQKFPSTTIIWNAK